MLADDGAVRTGAPEPRGPGATRLAGLARLGARLAMADSLEDLTVRITEGAAEVIGATAAMLALRDGPTRLRAVGLHGLSEAHRARFSSFELSDDLPIADAVRTGETVTLQTRADLLERYPHLDDGLERSSMSLPLVAPGSSHVLGAVGFRFDGRSDALDPDELSVLRVVADMCAMTMLRLQVEAESADRAARLQFLADASAALADSLDYRRTLSRVARLLVPTHADWASVQLVEDGVLRTLALAHADPAKVEMAFELERRWPPDPSSPTGAAAVARTGRSQLIEVITDEMLVAGARDDEHLRTARELGLRSALVVPLTAHGRVLGVLTLVSAESGRHYAPADVPFAEDLARRAALAIDNADLYSQTHRVAVELQANLLPQALPVLTGWDLASVYRQAGRTDVGGDFYDVLDAGSSRVAVFIGDVMGRGVDAAVAGSRMRAAARVLALQRPDPGTLAVAMDRIMAAEQLTPMATAAYLLLEPRHDRLRAVVAGHPPPLLLGADGTSRFLTEAGSPVLGVGAVARPVADAPFCVGDALVLYTDGLVERRGESIDVGLQRLADAAGLLRGPPRGHMGDPVERHPDRDGRHGARDAGEAGAAHELEDRLRSLVDSVSDPARHDDVAVLVLRRTA